VCGCGVYDAEDTLVDGEATRSVSKYPPLEDVVLDRHALLDRAWEHLNHLTLVPDTHLYFYVALDLRFFLESLLMDLLVCVRGEALSVRERNTYRAKEFAQMLEAHNEPVSEISKRALGFSITSDELRDLVIMYGKLGSLLHLPKDIYLADEQEFWKGHIEGFVGDSYALLERLHHNSRRAQ
jgi:hypothetical protein